MTAGRWRSYALLLRWQFLRTRQVLPMLVAMQTALGIGIVYGFGFLVPHITPTVALFFTTGAPTLSMILVGLTVVAQETAQSRVVGRFGYVSALPVPRLAPMLAEVTFWLLVQLPGWVLTLLLAMWHFHIHLQVSALIIPAVALVSLSTAAVGYGVAASAPPAATNQISQFVSIALLLFSPINFPLSRLPVVLQDIHRVLPVTYMADIVRGALSGRYDASKALAFGVVSAYCVVGLALAARAASRRR